MKEFDLEKLERAIIYAGRMADGRIPYSNLPIDSEILNNPNVIRCMFFIEDVLKAVKENGGVVGSKKAFFRPDNKKAWADFPFEVLKKFEYQKFLPISLVLKQFAELTGNPETPIISATNVNKWLSANGYIQKAVVNEEGNTNWVPTEKGKSIGIRVYIQGEKGREFARIVYDRNAQEFIANNLALICDDTINNRVTVPKEAAVDYSVHITEEATVKHLGQAQDSNQTILNKVDSEIKRANDLISKGDTREASKVFSAALELDPTREQVEVIATGNIICNIRFGHRNKANQIYYKILDTYGDVIGVDSLIKIASELKRVGDPNNARRYAIEAYNKSHGEVDQSLLDLIKVLWPEDGKNVSRVKNRKDPSSPDTYYKKSNEDIEPAHSCDNCKSYRNGDCGGLGGLCDDYEYVPTATKEEVDSWPWQMGPYVTGYNLKTKRK